jgi:hypothetical protein
MNGYRSEFIIRRRLSDREFLFSSSTEPLYQELTIHLSEASFTIPTKYTITSTDEPTYLSSYCRVKDITKFVLEMEYMVKINDGSIDLQRGLIRI